MRRVASGRPRLHLRPIEFHIEIPMEAFLGCRVMFQRARLEHMFGTAAAEAAAEVRGTVMNGSARGRILVVRLNARAGRWLGRKVALDCFFRGRCMGGRVKVMTVGTVVAVVLGRQFLEHQAHVALVVLDGVPSFGGKGSQLSEGVHLAGFGGHVGQVERR